MSPRSTKLLKRLASDIADRGKSNIVVQEVDRTGKRGRRRWKRSTPGQIPRSCSRTSGEQRRETLPKWQFGIRRRRVVKLLLSGGNVPPIRPGTSEISSAIFTGDGRNLHIRVLGKDFGKSPQGVPGVGNTAFLEFGEPVAIKEV